MFKTAMCMKYPNKLYSVGESVVGKMTTLIELIPKEGIGIEDLFNIASNKMVIMDFIDALTCLYLIKSVEITKENIVYRYAEGNNL